MVEKLFCRIVSCLAALVLAVCCAKDGDAVSDKMHPLRIRSVVTERVLSKAVIDGTSFPQSDAEAGIGLYLLDAADSSAYSPYGCSNVRYSDSGDGWNSTSPIPLLNRVGFLCGCFPYDASLSDYRRMPVVSSLNGTDYMYAVPVSGLSVSSQSADLTMRHALARISVTFIKDVTYTGEGLLSSLSMEGAGVAAEGYLDVLTGSISTSGAAAVSFTIPADDGTIVPEGLVKECLIVPVSDTDALQDVTLKCIIDGKEYSLVLDGEHGVVVKQGIQSNIVVKVNGGALVPVDVWVGEWGEGTGTSFDWDGKRLVTVRLEEGTLENDILFNTYSEGTSMVVEAFSKTGKALLCNVPETCSCLSSLDWETKIYRFVISGIKENVTAVIGYPHDDAVLARVRKDVPNSAYYKTVFVDAGYGLDDGTEVGGYVYKCPKVISADYPYEINITVDKECIKSSDTATFRSVFCESRYDLNGALLYPDGEPRFRVYYCFGGKAENAGAHGAAISGRGLENIRKFVGNGGSFVASGGAGAVFAGRSYLGVNSADYLSLYEGNALSTGTTGNTSVTIKLSENSPLLDYMTDKSSNSISQIRDAYGAYLDKSNAPAGVEILACYDNKGKVYYGQPAIWAYKAFPESGRIVLCGSKTERNTYDNVMDLFKAEIEYAAAGSGCAKVKGVLHNGEMRVMKSGGEDPEHCGIGDMQCHHFVMDIAKAASSVRLVLNWEKGASFELYLKKDSFALPDARPDYKVVDATASPIVLELSDVPAGLWYVTVRCVTVPKMVSSVFTGSHGFCTLPSSSQSDAQKATLSGGVPYDISALWAY